MEVPNILEDISDFIFTSKYSRYDEKLGRRETWDEAVGRLEKMHLKKYAFLNKEDKDKIRWAFDLVREKRVVPSMRSLQFGGKAIEAHNARIFNCCRRTTQFVTSSGVKSFEDFNDGDTVTVLTHTGSWKPAKVRSYGVQLLNKIVFQRSQRTQVEYFTANHTWILKNGQRTQNLQVGDILKGSENIFSDFDYDEASPFERLYWAYGYVFGDGTKVKNKNGDTKYSMVRLCGDDKQKFLSRFEEIGFPSSTPLSCNGDPIVFTGNYLKTCPNPEKDPVELVRAFVAGYLDADGAKNKNKQGSKFLSIQSSDIDHINFIRRCFPIAGVFILGEAELTGQTTNFGVRPYTINFSISTRFNNQDNSNSSYKVIAIEPFRNEEVWCLEVEDDHSFVLQNGLTTGNCSVTHIHSLRSFAEVFYLLLCGCGVGLGLNKEFLGRLPDLVDASDKNGTVLTYVVNDTIEGWADSVEALLMCYFRNTPFTGRKIVFDFSKIRPKGAPLKTGGGKAPGYKGLKNALNKIKQHLDHIIEYSGLKRLRTVDAYDILMHCADAVLSGGVRRSATSVIFEADDEDMLNAKTYIKVDKKWSFDKDGHVTLGGKTYDLYIGKVQYEGIKYDVTIKDYEYEALKKNNTIFWKHLFPQRARSNNSILILRNKISFEEFQSILTRTREFGEPGFVFADHPHQLFNPCFSKNQRILTDVGWRSFGELLGTTPNIIQDARVQGVLVDGKEQWNFSYDVKGCVNNTATKVTKTGTNNDVFILETVCGRVIEATGNHHFATKRGMVELKDLTPADNILVAVPEQHKFDISSYEWKLGFIAGLYRGDGTLNGKSLILDLWNASVEEISFIEKIVSNLVSECTDKPYGNTHLHPKFNVCNKTDSYTKYRLQSTLLYQLLNDSGLIDKNSSDNLHYFSKDFKSGFVSGMFFTDGHIDFNNQSRSLSLRITQSDKRFLINCSLILQELGVFAKVYDLLDVRDVQFKQEQKFYKCKPSFRLVIGGANACKRVLDTLHIFGTKLEKLKSLFSKINTNREPSFYARVKSITYKGKEDVFCLEENNRRTCIVEGVTTRRCFEIGFLPVKNDGVCGVQFCNLTSMNGRLIKTKKDFEECCIASAIIGTLQAGYTVFPYLSKSSEDLTREESLLGCSITGVMDQSETILNPETQNEMALLINRVNKEWASKLNINPAARTTCIKPEGTSSLVLGCASGIHFHHARRYFRRVQCNKLDPVYKYFKQFNPHVCEHSVWSENNTDDVVIFPIQIPETVKVKSDVGAIEHLEMIRSTQQNWVIPGSTTTANSKDITNNVSCTVIVKDGEWHDVSSFIYENQKYFSAISLLPALGDKLYPQAPMEAVVTEEDMYFWNKITSNWKRVDYTNFKESGDQTNLSSEIVCAGGACELVSV